ncbi:MAG: hypothetical protein J6S59_08475 [Clostridia bacterium]|nr:hypothetical protein [Clostridia bacterium]
MPSNMPDIRAVNEALRRAREMQRRSAPPPAPNPPVPEPSPAPVPIPEPHRAPEPHPLPPAPKERVVSPLDTFLKDRERTLILALLILLSGEENGTELLFALMYLLI